MKTNWRKYAAETLKIEEKFVSSLEKLLRSQFRSFLSLYKQNPNQALSLLTIEPWNQDLLPLLQRLYKQAGLIGAKRSFTELRQQQNQKFTGMGRNETWIRDVLQYLSLHLLNKAVVPISQTTKQHILKIMDLAINEGWGYDKIAEKLMDEGYIMARARVVARTEVNRASNVGHSIGARSFPYEVLKKWNAARDHRTRHSHRDVNNQVVSEDGSFKVDVYRKGVKVGHEEMLFPGDPEASAQNVINCRCRVTYIPKRDPKGRLIPRSTEVRITPSRSSEILSELINETVENIMEELFSE